MNTNEINVRRLCTGVKGTLSRVDMRSSIPSEPITRERSHDICQTRLLTCRVVFSIRTGA